MKAARHRIESMARPPRPRAGLWSCAAVALAGGVAAAEAGDWRVVSVNGLPAGGEAMFRFDPDGTLSGSTGCNRFTATARLTAGWLAIEGPVATTRMACPGDLSVQEQLILSVFEDGLALSYDPFVESLKLTGRAATILLASGPGSAPDLEPPAAPETPAPPAPASPPTEPAAPASPAADAPTIFDTAYVVVQGLSGRLNVRAEPSAAGKIVGGVLDGALLANKGCEDHPDRTWCHVAHIGTGRPDGWVAADFLRPAPATLRARDALFDRIGTLDCAASAGAATGTCDYGVARDPDGTVALTVFLPDGTERLVAFRNGALLPAETGGDGGTVSATAAGDLVRFAIGDGRFELPASVLSGD